MTNPENKKIDRRKFLRISFTTAGGIIAAACSQPQPRPTESPRPATELKDIASHEFDRSYSEWFHSYVTDRGTLESNQLRVIDPDTDNEGNQNRTVSEGIGYGILLAVAARDFSTVERLFNYYSYYAQNNPKYPGFMPWRITAEGKVSFNSGTKQIDYGPATDADLDVALGLVLSSFNHGFDTNQKNILINLILQQETEPHTGILKPGSHWGGSDVLNPSYISPYHFQVFADATKNQDWLRIAAANRQVIDNIHRNLGGDKTGLVPNWATAEGTIAPDYMGPDRNFYGYDAIRYPWRQALAVANLDHNSPAYQHAHVKLKKINDFFETVGALNIVDGYDLNGKAIGHNHNNAFVATAATAAVVSSNSDYQKAILDETIRLNQEGYYSDSLRLLSLAHLGQRFPKTLS